LDSFAAIFSSISKTTAAASGFTFFSYEIPSSFFIYYLISYCYDYFLGAFFFVFVTRFLKSCIPFAGPPVRFPLASLSSVSKTVSSSLWLVISSFPKS